MKTKIIELNKNNIEIKKLKEITKAFKEGKTVVFPTETVYGLGANGLDTEACLNIFKAKKRPSDNPLILHIAEKEQLNELTENISEIAQKCMDKFWPGPLTIIFKKSNRVPDIVTAGLDTVAIRMPSNEIARAILKDCKLPIAAPSANLSGKPSSTTFKHVIDDLNDRVDIIINSENAELGIESTVLDLSVNPPIILRPGQITLEDIKKIIPNVTIDNTIIDSKDNSIPKSPGQKYKHYAPKAEAYCFIGEFDEVAKEINKRINGIKSHSNKRIAVLTTEQNKDKYENYDLLINLGSRNNLEEIASNLFYALRNCDENDMDIIYSEGFDISGIGMGIMNRLLKACGGKIIFGL